MHRFRQLDWPLIVGLGCLALLHPLLSSTGLGERVGRPLGPWLVTALVSASWVATVVLSRVREPLLTLGCTGLAAGLAVIAAGALPAPALTGRPGALIAGPAALVAVLAANTLWGTLAGLLAAALQRALRAGGQAEDR